MVTLIRLEAEGKELNEVVADLDAAQKALKLQKDMVVHDEHYERSLDKFKGRRVFKRGGQPALLTTFSGGSSTAVTSPMAYSVTNCSAG